METNVKMKRCGWIYEKGLLDLDISKDDTLKFLTPQGYFIGEIESEDSDTVTCSYFGRIIYDYKNQKYTPYLTVNKNTVEIYRSFSGWLSYLKIPRCYYCDEITSEEYLCEGGCGELYCESCSATVTFHNMIEKNCCSMCQEMSKWREID